MPLRTNCAALVAALSLGACAYHSPSTPTPTEAPARSNAPASITLTAASRPDRQLDVWATVLTADGRFVPDVAVTFGTSSGSFVPANSTTDGTGRAATVLATPERATITAVAGDVQSAPVVVLPSVQPPTPPPPPAPSPTPVPDPTPPFTVTLLATPGLAGSPTLFGMASTAITRATWTFGDGSAVVTTTASSTSHVYANAGTYTAGVTVTSVGGPTVSASRTVAITAPPPPQPPPLPVVTILFASTCGGTTPTRNVTLSCSVSVYDETGKNVTFLVGNILSWDWGDGVVEEGKGVTNTHTYAQPATYALVVRATVNGIVGIGYKGLVIAP